MEYSFIRSNITVLCVLFIFLAGQSQAAPFAYIPNFSDATVSIIDTETLTVTDTVMVPIQPVNVEVHPSGETVYIGHSTTSTVSVINASTNELVTAINVGPGPQGMAIHPDGSKLYVAVGFADQVVVIDTSTNDIIDSIYAGDHPNGMVVLPDGSALFVINALSNDISVIDTTTNSVVDTFGYFPAASRGVVVSPDGENIYVLDSDEIAVISVQSRMVINSIPLGNFGTELSIHPDGQSLYITSSYSDAVITVDTTTNDVRDVIYVCDEPLGVNVHPKGDSLYVACQEDNIVKVFDTEDLSLIENLSVGDDPIAFGQFIGPLPEFVGGTVSGVIIDKILCRNGTTHKRVVIELDEGSETSWDCEAAGLEVETGDIIIQTITGIAQ